jgi:hypothetical protein
MTTTMPSEFEVTSSKSKQKIKLPSNWKDGLPERLPTRLTLGTSSSYNHLNSHGMNRLPELPTMPKVDLGFVIKIIDDFKQTFNGYLPTFSKPKFEVPKIENIKNFNIKNILNDTLNQEIDLLNKYKFVLYIFLFIYLVIFAILSFMQIVNFQ